MHADAWNHHLKHHPDRALVQTAIQGIIAGIYINFTGDRTRSQDCNNLKSANDHPTAITADIQREVAKGRIAGPFDQPPTENFIASPLGAVEKKDSGPNPEYRRIHHLSWPRFTGVSVNDQIDDIEIRYISIDHAVRMAHQIGKGALLAKLDVKSAFRCVPVHPSERHLLGMRWHGKYYADLCLPFGLKSSPAMWGLYSNLAEWILHFHGVKWICHYVDDFLVGGRGDSNECLLALALVVKSFGALGIPINPEKLAAEGTPATICRFLGIVIDTVKQTLSLDANRLARIKTSLAEWSAKTSCTATELQSMIGTLAFAAKVIQPGRSFLRRMIGTLTSHRHSPSRIPLDSDFQRDIKWWSTFISVWNGTASFYDDAWTRSDALRIYSDASNTGYGAAFGSRWFTGAWTEADRSAALRSERESMPYFELLALVLAASTFGRHWHGKRIEFICDCEPVVFAISRHSSPQPELMQLIRTLQFVAYQHHFTFRCVHIPSTHNSIADALSRVTHACPEQAAADVNRLRMSYPHIDRSPTPVLSPPIHDW